ncbi:hypothetical protein ACOSQ3_023665 [Xanthoceras sorbifolium]
MELAFSRWLCFVNSQISERFKMLCPQCNALAVPASLTSPFFGLPFPLESSFATNTKGEAATSLNTAPSPLLVPRDCMETRLDNHQMERIRVKLGFSGKLVDDCVGRSGGLCLLWSPKVSVDLLSFSLFHIDVCVRMVIRFGGSRGFMGIRRGLNDSMAGIFSKGWVRIAPSPGCVGGILMKFFLIRKKLVASRDREFIWRIFETLLIVVG